MSYTLSQASTSRRSSLLTIVIGLHVGIFLLIFAAKTVVPQIMEMPLVVDLLQPAEPKPEPKPLPVVKPQPVRQPSPAPKAPAPQIEATQSTAPAPSAPVAAPPEVKPAPPAPAALAVTQARFDADYLRNPAPPYPPLSRRMGEEGKVVLRVLVSLQGTAEQVEVKTSSGSERLDNAAVNTVKNWKFIAARRGDTPTQSWVLVPIIFKLEQ
ncbi:energy transducer TonB [Dechloromonas denitrificans]|uniref:energy transducer TonB n=1 Tax=Dechloromonas denitrificans TaxID=281362 RepID=UPI001CF84158|nr:energy transducer TonB [Dechloromonas denitrificans]UCV10700.1 energy transducer TonB [Dechloromonas denitrificans]